MPPATRSGPFQCGRRLKDDCAACVGGACEDGGAAPALDAGDDRPFFGSTRREAE